MDKFGPQFYKIIHSGHIAFVRKYPHTRSLTALICEVFELAATSDKTVGTVSIYFITLGPYYHPSEQ